MLAVQPLRQKCIYQKLARVKYDSPRTPFTPVGNFLSESFFVATSMGRRELLQGSLSKKPKAYLNEQANQKCLTVR